jgi:hypothetical protein
MTQEKRDSDARKEKRRQDVKLVGALEESAPPCSHPPPNRKGLCSHWGAAVKVITVVAMNTTVKARAAVKVITAIKVNWEAANEYVHKP